ncbi:hypothetical protein OG696_08835 [Streptomyces sp. NBC_00656]
MVPGASLKAKVPGALLAEVEEPLRPKFSEPPAGMLSVQDVFAAWTVEPAWLSAAFHAKSTF